MSFLQGFLASLATSDVAVAPAATQKTPLGIDYWLANMSDPARLTIAVDDAKFRLTWPVWVRVGHEMPPNFGEIIRVNDAAKQSGSFSNSLGE